MHKTRTRKSEKTALPADRWRNRYWFSREINLADTASHAGGPFGPGVLVARVVWPSQDVAETIARRCIEKHPLGDFVVYLGAEPASAGSNDGS
jgi:hypothetical protein